MKTKIEWCDYTINPIKGLCPMACSYCYARRMYKRFKWNSEIQWNEQCFIDLKRIKQPSRIFVGSTMELFGNWIEDKAINYIFQWVKEFPQHTFIFLTKQPQNLSKWSPFPDNCWVGVSATDIKMFIRGCEYLRDIGARTKFISIEPLLKWSFNWSGEDLRRSLSAINWLIIGQQTPVSPKTQPKIEWLQEIVEAADKAGIPIFLKDNILELVNYNSPEFEFAFNKDGYYRQEFPKERG